MQWQPGSIIYCLVSILSRLSLAEGGIVQSLVAYPRISGMLIGFVITLDMAGKVQSL